MFLNSEGKYEEADHKVTFIGRKVNFHHTVLVKIDSNTQFNRFYTDIITGG